MNNNLKLLLIITTDGYEKRIKEVFKRNNIYFRFVTRGRGTASHSLLDYFGLVETAKDVVFGVIHEAIEEKLSKQLIRALSLDKPGSGIALTIPISSANKFLLDKFGNKQVNKETETMSKIKYHLIITSVLEGNLETVMVAAKKAGASGGTVISGRSLGNSKSIKAFGFEIEPERDLILTVVEDSIKTAVMEEITKNVGIKTVSKGYCIAIPVDNAYGIGDTKSS